MGKRVESKLHKALQSVSAWDYTLFCAQCWETTPRSPRGRSMQAAQRNLGTQVIIVATVLTIWVLCPGIPLTKDKGRGKMLNTKQKLPPQTPWPANTPTAATTAKPATKGCKGCPVGGKLSSRVLSPTCHADIIPTAPT